MAAAPVLAGSWLAAAADPTTAALPGRNGKKLAFTTTRDGNREIYVMRADGSRQTNRTANGASDIDPDWQPRPRR